MDKIFQDAKDKNVAAVNIYYDATKPSTNGLFVDTAFTVPATSDVIVEAALKGTLNVIGIGANGVLGYIQRPVLVVAPSKDLYVATFTDGSSAATLEHFEFE